MTSSNWCAFAVGRISVVIRATRLSAGSSGLALTPKKLKPAALDPQPDSRAACPMLTSAGTPLAADARSASGA